MEMVGEGGGRMDGFGDGFEINCDRDETGVSESALVINQSSKFVWWL